MNLNPNPPHAAQAMTPTIHLEGVLTQLWWYTFIGWGVSEKTTSLNLSYIYHQTALCQGQQAGQETPIHDLPHRIWQVLPGPHPPAIHHSHTLLVGGGI
jgi:hypothetical protein